MRMPFFNHVLSSVIVLSISGMVSAGEIPQQVKDLRKAAQDSIKQKNPDQAIQQYQQLIKAFPNTKYAFEAQAEIVQCHIKEKDFEKARLAAAPLFTTYQSQPEAKQAIFKIVQKCMYAGACSQARAICADAENHFSSQTPSVRFTGWKGMVAAYQKDFVQAEQMADTLLEIKSNANDFLEAMGNIGWGYFCVGEWDHALVVYRRGLARHPGHKVAAYLQYHMVQTCLRKGDIAAAEAEVKTLLSQYSHRDYTLGLAGRLALEFRQREQSPKALEIYQQLLTQFSAHKDIADVQDSLVETYADMGELDKAQEALETDIQKYPGHKGLPKTITRVAVETARAGEISKAMDLANAIFAQNPQGTEELYGYTTRARVYVYQGEDEKAQKAVDEILEQFKDYSNGLAYHLFGVGEEFFNRADGFDDPDRIKDSYQKALAVWRRIEQVVPEHKYPQYSYFSGIACHRLGQYEQAIAFFERVVSTWPGYEKNWHARFMMTDCLAALAAAGKMDKTQAESLKQAQYRLILQKHFDCPVADFVRQALNSQAQ